VIRDRERLRAALVSPRTEAARDAALALGAAGTLDDDAPLEAARAAAQRYHAELAERLPEAGCGTAQLEALDRVWSESLGAFEESLALLRARLDPDGGIAALVSDGCTVSLLATHIRSHDDLDLFARLLAVLSRDRGRAFAVAFREVRELAAYSHPIWSRRAALAIGGWGTRELLADLTDTQSYQSRIWNRFRKRHPVAWLPPIAAVLVSHAPGGWSTSRSLEDLFDPSVRAVPALAELVPRASLIIEDLAQLSNADLRARSLAAFPKLALWLLRDARDPRRLLDSFDAWIDIFAEAERAPAGSDAITVLLTYMFRVVDPMHHDELHAKVRQLGTHAEEIAMTIAEMWLEQGREEGLVKGRKEGQIAALRGLLAFKFGSPTLDRRYEAMLHAATPEAIDRYLQRVLRADSLAAVFED
jgi:hypothetical protein